MTFLRDEELLEVLEYWRDMDNYLKIPDKYQDKITRRDLILQILSEIGTRPNQPTYPEVMSVRSKLKDRLREDSNNEEKGQIISVLFSWWPPVLRIIEYTIEVKIPWFQIPQKFWELIGITALLLFLIISNIPLESVLLTFVLILLLEVVASNKELLLKKSEQLSPKNRRKLFLEAIDDRKREEVIKFIQKSELTTDEIETICKSKHGNAPDVLGSIIASQSYDCEFIGFLQRERKMAHLSPKQIAFLVSNSTTAIPLNLRKALFKKTDYRIKGALAVVSGSFVKAKYFPPVVIFVLNIARIVNYLRVKRIPYYVSIFLSYSITLSSILGSFSLINRFSVKTNIEIIATFLNLIQIVAILILIYLVISLTVISHIVNHSYMLLINFIGRTCELTSS